MKLQITFKFISIILMGVTFCFAGQTTGYAESSKSELFFVASKKGIYSGRMDSKIGEITSLSLAAEVASPGFLAVHPNRKFLYSVNTAKIDGKNAGVVSAFSIEPTTGKLTLLNHRPTGGTGPTHLALDKAGKNVLVANYGSGSVAAFPIGKNGLLKSSSDFVQHNGSSVNAQRQTGPHAHSITTDPKSHFVLSCDLGLDKVLIYKFDSARGSLIPNEPAFVSLKPGAGPRHHAFHPGGKFLYVINELDSTMTALSYDAKKGGLKEIQNISTLPQNFAGINYPSEVAVHPSGKFLYGSNRGHDSMVVYAIDKKSGTLSPIEYELTLGKFPRHFEINPSGKFLLVENQNSGNIVVFRIDQKTGDLTPTGNIIEVEAPQCLKFF